ncbi:MAG: DNA helicase RecQ [Cellvibrionaceae bacterium]|nr:DNA helicase RecQ [Cellvibrionaceae bacterium]
MTTQALDILKHTFGYDAFRGQQKAIIDALTEGKNTLVVMPTGGGKSLCYQVPALLRTGIGVVVSPLIALMQDQVNALRKQGVRADYLNSTLAAPQTAQIEANVCAGDLDLLYIAPERLIQERTLNLLRSAPIALFAIDEAHCVAQWGHDFRADYLRLEMLAEHFPDIPRIALTATADSKTQIEIAQRLKLEQDATFICGFDRPNIQYRIHPKNKPKQQLLQFLQTEHSGDAGVVYCLSRKRVEDIARWLCDQGINALPYHGAMAAAIRQQHQETFLREEGIVMVATIAFGMGIDKPNVRFVCHLDMPKSLEAYYQETGRAGRDGDPATAVLFYGMEDVVKISQMVASSQGNEQFKRHEQQRLNAMLGLCEMTTCRRQALLRYFGEQLEHPCGNCDNCLTPPQTWDATETAQKALSCVYRTGQRFGAGHVIDVLRGADNEKVRQFGHQQLSTYAIGKEISANEWRSIFRQLVVMGFLEVDASGYGNLCLTEASRPLLRGQQSIQLRREAKTAKAVVRQQQADIAEEDLGLWQALRQCRKTLADEHKVPPYVIFHDATLKEMIAQRPMNTDELLAINGVGDRKLEQFGDAFLTVISEFEYRAL